MSYTRDDGVVILPGCVPDLMLGNNGAMYAQNILTADLAPMPHEGLPAQTSWETLGFTGRWDVSETFRKVYCIIKR